MGLSSHPHRVPDKDPVTTHVSPWLPIAGAKVNETREVAPLSLQSRKSQVGHAAISVNVPVTVKIDPVWLPTFTLDEKPKLPILPRFWHG